MNTKPIGIFDSGLGGLTAVKELISLLPGEDIVYFGDTGRVPYGSRSEDTIIKYADQDIRFLLRFDIKFIIAACGTVSSVALPHLAGRYPVPIIGVVEAAAEAAVKASRSGVIAVLGTAGTIRSGAYERAIKKRQPKAEVHSVPCPLFVPLVENGHTHSQAAEYIAREYLDQIIPDHPDTIILGCTHYPLLKEVIGKIMGPDVTLIDAGKAAADYVHCVLSQEGLCNSNRTNGRCEFFVSDAFSGFSELAETFLGQSIEKINSVSIEQITAAK